MTTGKKSPSSSRRTAREASSGSSAKVKDLAEYASRYQSAEETKRSQPPKNNIWQQKILPVIGWCVWLVFAFFAANFIVALTLVALKSAHVMDLTSGTLGTALLDAILYIVIFAIAIWLPLKRMKRSRNASCHPEQSEGSQQGSRDYLATPRNGTKRGGFKSILSLTGLSRLPRLKDLGYFASNLPMFYVVDVIAMILAMLIFGSNVMDQQQSIGFATSGQGVWQLIVIFMALVIIPPLFEEALMRGLLFGKLRKILPFWATSLIVSALFAVAHWQINVSLMTFILSMFNCHIREKTGSIWGGVFMHMAVNFISFGVLFLGWLGGASM